MSNFFLESIIQLFERDLTRLSKEIDTYTNESDLWIVQDEIKNSAGTLCLHLSGNLNHFIGALLGNTGYIRDRHAEFHDKNIPKTELIRSVHQTKEMLSGVLNSLSRDQLEDYYPLEVLGYKMTTLHFILHLQGHLNYHLGQINYHRRLLAR